MAELMTGRGIDQVLPSPGDPALRERLVRDARGYVALAESVNGPIPRPVPPSWPWGDALTVLEEAQPDVRIINLETSVTGSGDFAPGKTIIESLRELTGMQREALGELWRTAWDGSPSSE